VNGRQDGAMNGRQDGAVKPVLLVAALCACGPGTADDPTTDSTSGTGMETTGTSSTSPSTSTASASSSSSGVGDTSGGTSHGPGTQGSTDTSSESTSGTTCVDLATPMLSGACGTMAAQETNVLAQGEGIAFVGTRSFFGAAACGDCGSLRTLAVYVFEDTPEDTEDLSQSTAPMLTFEVDTSDAAFETTVTFSHAATGQSVDAAPTSVTVVATPSEADFGIATDDAPPRLSVTIESADADLQLSGTIDAVYCAGANYFIPCE
jgi:hypothetical protein